MTDHLYAVKKLVDRLDLQAAIAQRRGSRLSGNGSNPRSRGSKTSTSTLHEDIGIGPGHVRRRSKCKTSPTSGVSDRSADGLLSPCFKYKSGSFSSISSAGPVTSPGLRSCSSSDEIFTPMFDALPLESGNRNSRNGSSASLISVGSVEKRNETSRRKVSVTKSMPMSPSEKSLGMKMEKYHDIQLKIDVLTSELMTMRKSDQDLAKKLLNIYTDIQSIKMAKSCLKYCELLDDAYFDAEMADEVPDLCDASPKSINKVLLKKGVTSFNISSRRFSCS